MPDRRLDPYLRDRLADIQQGYLRLSRRILAAHAFQAAVLILTLAAFGLLLQQGRERGQQNCDRIHRLVGTLGEIIGDSRQRIGQYESEGLLDHAQAQRAFRDNADQRARLAVADCIRSR